MRGEIVCLFRIEPEDLLHSEKDMVESVEVVCNYEKLVCMNRPEHDRLIEVINCQTIPSTNH